MAFIERLRENVTTRREVEDKTRMRFIFASLWDVVADGIDADDFEPLVEAFRELIAEVVPMINVPYVPEMVEKRLIDPLVIPVLQGFADDIVGFVFERFGVET